MAVTDFNISYIIELFLQEYSLNKIVSLTDSFLKRYDSFRVFLIHCIDYSMADTLTMIFVLSWKVLEADTLELLLALFGCEKFQNEI